MKLLVLNYEYPPLGGGAGVVTQNISEGLAKIGHEVTVITTWFEGENEVEKNENLVVIRLKSKRKYRYRSDIFEMLSWVRGSKSFLMNYCKSHRFDLCLANFTIPGGTVALFLKNKFKLNYVILSHGHDIPWMFPRQMFFYHLFTFFRIKNICTVSEVNILLTEELKANADRFLGEALSNKNIIIPNGVDFNVFKQDQVKRSKIFKVLFVGRLVNQKDPLTFLRGIELYSKKNKNICVNIIGDGQLREKMEKYIRSHDMQSFVKLSGWLSKEAIISEYQSAQVQVLSSVYEAMSVSALEALACGCFLISTPLDSMSDLIEAGVNGSFIKFDSADEIAQRLEEYYDHKYFSGYKVSQEYINRLKEKYSWGHVIKQYETHLLNYAQA